MTVPGMLDEYAAYLAERDCQRAQRIDRAWLAMTRRERRLVREAAVMGYVHGLRAGLAGDKKVPDGYAITATVIGACQAMPDLYPVISHLERRR